ncbi:hypothetical protein G3570_09960 [Balneolaceae bacterium YR4-1]|uniref:Uncharacterized protein n=1 Tax=Halalkalibaculum roseum TaxID=2709311 RepID=A0A6M1SXH1_9BACT|nr:hypothetical protein [Halalkalibaculum roseum]NGP76958.1 hypothetical protein [Halalkalibaculum roseum]
MNSKRLTVTILFFLASVSTLMAQQAAQATMKVQVTVIEGNSISMHQPQKVVLNKSVTANGLTELSKISFSREPGSVFIMQRPEKMLLRDESGKSLELPVTYQDYITDQGITSELNLVPLTETARPAGSLKGTLTTSVAYL